MKNLLYVPATKEDISIRYIIKSIIIIIREKMQKKKIIVIFERCFHSFYATKIVAQIFYKDKINKGTLTDSQNWKTGAVINHTYSIYYLTTWKLKY